MQELKHVLLTNKYTEICHEDVKDFKFNAPNHFIVFKSGDSAKILSRIDFQEGPIKENGINGVNNEDLIAMVIRRLEYFQKSDYACRENELAIAKLEEGLMWLRRRTTGRENRGVEGTREI